MYQTFTNKYHKYLKKYIFINSLVKLDVSKHAFVCGGAETESQTVL